uniref:Uncharacterized protein n=1 Tax=Arundo donax TaxID=35708 RepID=A0A0A9BFT3_ARUDO
MRTCSLILRRSLHTYIVQCCASAVSPIHCIKVTNRQSSLVPATPQVSFHCFQFQDISIHYP